MTNDDVTNQQIESSDQTAEAAHVGLGLGLDEAPPVTPAIPEEKEQA